MNGIKPVFQTDVRVIPVTMEGDSTTDSGRSGTKRHSASQPDPGPIPRKRTQEESHGPRERSSSKGRGAVGVGEERRPCDNRDEQEERRSRERSRRRGSEMYSGTTTSPSKKDDPRRKSYPDSSSKKEGKAYTVNIQRSDKENENSANKRRSRVIAEDEEEDKHEQRNRQRSSKYEEAREINIPIRVEGSGDTDGVLPYPASGGKKVVAQTEEKTPKENTTKHEPSQLFASSKVSKPEKRSSIGEGNERTRVPESTSVRSNLGDEKENIKPSKVEPTWKYSNAYQNKSPSEESKTDRSPTKVTKTSDMEPKRYYFGDKPVSDVEVRVVPPVETKAPEVEKKTEIKNLGKDADKTQTKEGDDGEDKKVINKENTEEYNNFLKAKANAQDSVSPSSGSKSPLIGREVKVEQKQSDMEGDMFNDCWQNFSSTLQDVLSRLQELSAELGHARSLVTPPSPPTSAEVAAAGDSKEDKKSPGQDSAETANKQVFFLAFGLCI